MPREESVLVLLCFSASFLVTTDVLTSIAMCCRASGSSHLRRGDAQVKNVWHQAIALCIRYWERHVCMQWLIVIPVTSNWREGRVVVHGGGVCVILKSCQFPWAFQRIASVFVLVWQQRLYCNQSSNIEAFCSHRFDSKDCLTADFIATKVKTLRLSVHIERTSSFSQICFQCVKLLWCRMSREE